MLYGPCCISIKLQSLCAKALWRATAEEGCQAFQSLLGMPLPGHMVAVVVLQVCGVDTAPPIGQAMKQPGNAKQA